MRVISVLLAVIMLSFFNTNILADEFNLNSQRNTGLWRFELDNDFFMHKDSNFSNGWSLQHHSMRYATWDESEAFSWTKWIGKNFPTLGDEGSIVRYARGIGQNIITPGDISNPNPPPGDLPYAGTLTYNQGWQRFNSETASIFQINFGVLGEEALGEEVQKFVHVDLGFGDTPEGWDTQRDTELVLNFAYSHQWRVLQFGGYDNAWGGQVATGISFHLGNIITAGDLGVAFRCGWNIPEGFNSYPAPPGRGIFSNLILAKPETASPHSIEFVMAARASGLVYSVLYDGSLITDDERDVEREDYIISGLLGINYHYYDLLSFRLSLITSSELMVEESLPEPINEDEDKTSTDTSYGTFMIDFHF